MRSLNRQNLQKLARNHNIGEKTMVSLFLSEYTTENRLNNTLLTKLSTNLFY